MTSLELRPDLTDLAALAEALESFGSAHRLDPDVLSVVHLALEELLTALSATAPRPTGPDGHIHVQLAIDGRALVVRVEKRADQALGATLDLVSSLMDEVTYGHENGRQRVTLRKTLR